MSFTDNLVCAEQDISGLNLSVDVVYNLLTEGKISKLKYYAEEWDRFIVRNI